MTATTIEKAMARESQSRELKTTAQPSAGGGGNDDYQGPNWTYGGRYNPPPPYMLEDHSGLDLSKIIQSLWYYRGMFLTIALVLSTIAVLFNPILFPDKYEATSRVRVKMLNILDDAAMARTFSIIPTEVLSDKVLTDVVEDLGLAKRNKVPFIESMLTKIGIEPKAAPEDGSGIIRWLRQDVEINQERQGMATAVFTVSLTDKNPEVAANIVNAIVQSYMELRHTFETSDASEAVAFLTPKVEAAEANLEMAHRDLTAFQMNNMAYLVPADTIEENIQRLQREYTDSGNRIDQLRELNLNLKKLLDGEPRWVNSGTAPADAPSAAAAELAALESRFAKAQATYTNDHPYIKQLSADIEALRTAAARQPRAVRSNGRVSNPEWLALSQEIAANEAEATVLERQQPAIRENIIDLTEQLSRAKSAQAALLTHQTSWDQAYNQLRLLNEQYLQAQTQADAQSSAVGKDLSILDDAAVPTLPVTPSRTLLMGLGLIGGFAAAFMLVLVYARIKNFAIPEDGTRTNLITAILLNTIGITWLVALVGYIVITPYI